MIPILYEPTERDFDTYGLGKLADVISCEVTEERNGEYELEMEYPITGIHFSEIENRCFILAKPNYTDDLQAFRIYAITKPLDGKCTIKAQHITYDMSGYIIPGGLSADSLTDACDLLTEYAEDFTITATKTGSSDFATDVPASVRSWLGGKTGSFLDLYGGEWKWDNFTATLMTARGEDRGVQIRYGKNLLSLEQEEDAGSLYTGVIAYWYDGESETLVTSDVIETGLELDTPKVYAYDCSADYEEEPSVDTLNAKAESYISNNELTTINTSVTLDFSQLGELSERVDLCDTVEVIFERLGVSTQCKCTETVWDVIKERYTSITLGTSSTNIVDRILESDKVVDEVKSILESTITRVSALIKGSSGGYIVHNDTDGDGYIDELLIMNTPDISTATKVWRWNLNGFGYSSTGYDGTYGTAITMDGEIVADFITAGTMYANRIKGGTLTLGGDSNEYGVISVLDADGNTIGSWNRSGITATGTITTESDYYSAKLTSGTIRFYWGSDIAFSIYASNTAYGEDEETDYYGISQRLGDAADYLKWVSVSAGSDNLVIPLFFDRVGCIGTSNVLYLNSRMSCPRYIQMGVTSVSTTPGSRTYANVTFGTEFLDTPAVIVTPRTSRADCINATAVNVTTTDFDIYVYVDSSISETSVRVMWLAIYDPTYDD